MLQWKGIANGHFLSLYWAAINSIVMMKKVKVSLLCSCNQGERLADETIEGSYMPFKQIMLCPVEDVKLTSTIMSRYVSSPDILWLMNFDILIDVLTYMSYICIHFMKDVGMSTVEPLWADTPRSRHTPYLHERCRDVYSRTSLSGHSEKQTYSLSSWKM